MWTSNASPGRNICLNMLESNLELAFSMKHEAFGVRVRADDKEERLKVLPPTTRFVNP